MDNIVDTISPDEKSIIDDTLRRLQNKEKDRPPIPSHKVKLFLQIIGDELKRTGDVKKPFVDRVVQQLKSGEL